MRRFGGGSLLAVLVVLGLVTASPLDAAPRSAAGGSATARYIVSLRGLRPTAGSTLGPISTRTGAALAQARAAEVQRVAQVDRTVDRLAGQHGIQLGMRYHDAIQGFAASLNGAQVAALRANPAVGSVTAVRPIFLAGETVPNGVKRIGADPGTSPVPNLSGVNVAVLDTGIRYIPGDPELNVNSTGIDCTNDERSGLTGHRAWEDQDSFNGHGTHVAGTLGARDTDSGIVGVAPGVRLFSVRIFAPDVWGNMVGDTETVTCGIDWVASTHSLTPPARTQPIDVANMSIQGPIASGDGPSCSSAASTADPEHAAICQATGLGVTFVVAAGNSSRNAAGTVPAVFDSVITVSALNDYDGKPGALAGPNSCSPEPDDSFASYSNYGAPVDLIAPGSCIQSLGRRGGTTRQMSGTSMATPHVSGAAARYVAMLLQAGTPHDAAHINATVVRDALRAAANLDWSTGTDPDSMPDRLLDVASLQASAARQTVKLWTFPTLLTSGAPSGGPTDPVDSTVSFELQRYGLYRGNVSVTATATPDTGVTFTQSTRELGPTGISGAFQVRVDERAPDGDVVLTLTPSCSCPVAPQPTSATLRVDRHKPVIQNFRAAIVDHVKLSDGHPVRLSWSGSDPGGSIARYEIQRRDTPSSGWTPFSISPPTATSVVRFVPTKTTYGFRVRAVDAVGNVSDWAVLNLRVGVRDSSQPTISYSSNNSWTTRSQSKAYGGSFRRSITPGAFAAVTFSGRGVAWVAPVAPGKGTAKVYIDGTDPAHLVATIDQSASQQKQQQVIWSSGSLSPGRHTLVIKVVRGTIDLDAIVVLS